MKEKIPTTMAIRYLESHKIPYVPKFYKYMENGGTSHSSKELSVDEHSVIKTIVLEDNNKEPFIVLMNGDKSISEKNMARIRGVKTVSLCKAEVANKHTGYLIGGTSPFGTKRKMKVYIEKAILDLDKIYINGGKRGFLVEIDPKNLTKVLDFEIIEVSY